MGIGPLIQHANRRYCVRTATEVSPRTEPVESVNATKMRFTAGLKVTLPFPATKIPKVGVALALIVVDALAAAVARQAPVCGLVWHSVRVTGNTADPVLA